VSSDRSASLSVGGWSFDVPAHAVNRNTVMGLWTYSQMTPGLPQGLGVECEITPAGLTLSAPATLSFGYGAAGLTSFDPHLLRIYRLDVNLGQWVECPTTLDDSHGNVSTTASTDSRYALGIRSGL